MEDLQKKLYKILENIVSKDKKVSISLDSDLVCDLGLDSIKLMRLIFELEKKAGYDTLKASEEVDFSEITKVGDVYNILIKYNKTNI